MQRRWLVHILSLTCTGTAVGTPICVPAHPKPRAELYVMEDPVEKMSVGRLEKLARKNDPRALNVLGILYGTGRGVPLDSEKSFEFYRRAAELGMPMAQVNLAYMYLKGEGVAADPALAMSWAKKAVDVGDMRGQEFIAQMLGRGEDGVEENLVEAAFCMLLAARQGHLAAQQQMANIYELGYGIPVNLREANYWHERASADRRSGKIWFDETPLTEIPAEWQPPFEFAEELPADALVRTPNYSFEVKAPTAALAKSTWDRHVGKPETRNSGLVIGLRGYDTYAVQIEVRGTLGAGEDLAAAARRIRPTLEFQAVPGRRDCVRSNDKAPEKLSSMLLMTAVCLRPKDRELYEIGVSHNSLTYAAREPEARDTEELAAEMNLVLTTFRFE